MKKLCNLEVYKLDAQGLNSLNNCKNGRFGYEVIGEARADVELLEVVAFIYPFTLKAGSPILSATGI